LSKELFGQYISQFCFTFCHFDYYKFWLFPKLRTVVILLILLIRLGSDWIWMYVAFAVTEETAWRSIHAELQKPCE
ncbi:TPA: hypothetical protein ACGUU0_004074, partial [Vibrio vulnificus]